MPADTVYVGRPSKWGNPFDLSAWNRREAVYKYEDYVDNMLKKDKFWLKKLKGKDLACWCSLDQLCHADVLIKKVSDRYDKNG